MKAAAILSLCSAAALASAAPPPADSSRPRPDEDVQVKNLSVRKEVQGASSKVTHVDFDLVGRDETAMKCSANDYKPPNVLPNVLKSGYCTDSKYTFSLFSDGSEFALSVSHQVADGYGFTGTKQVPTYCKAGGLGTTDLACSQIESVVCIPIYNPLPPTSP